MNRGGAETIVMNFYRNIDRTKIQFDFILHSKRKGAYDEEIRELGGRIFYVPRYSLKSALNYMTVWNRFFREHPEYRVIHGHIRSTASIYLAIAKKYKLATIAHSHNTESGSGLNAFVKDTLQRPLKSNWVDYLFACSESSGEWLFGSKNMPRVSILKNAIDANRFAYNEIIRIKTRKELGLDQNSIIGHVGRFDEQKNHKFLIDIFNVIHKQNRNAVLLLVGAGHLEPQIKDKVKKLGLESNVRFMGVRSDIPELLQAMDIFVFPSHYEGLPVAIIEAQAAGLMCVLSDAITTEVKITDLVTFISLSESAEQWAEKILAYQENVARENTYANIVNAGYDVKSTANWLQEFYIDKHLLNTSRRN
jgi:Glycosyltransferase